MNVYRRELRFMFGSMIMWALALTLVALMYMVIYPSFSHDTEVSKKLLEHFPPLVKSMLGLSLSAFYTYLGFYAYTFSYITLAGAVQGMNVGLGLYSKEDAAKTTDFLLSKPLRRRKIFIAKLAAGLTIICGTTLLYTAIVYGLTFIVKVGDFEVKKYLMLSLAFLIIQIWFFALGILVSQLVRKVRSVVALSLSFVFGFFIAGLIGAIIGDEKIRYVTPFKYFDYLQYVTSGVFGKQYVILAGTLILGAIIVSFVAYNKRDIKSAI